MRFSDLDFNQILREFFTFPDIPRSYNAFAQFIETRSLALQKCFPAGSEALFQNTNLWSAIVTWLAKQHHADSTRKNQAFSFLKWLRTCSYLLNHLSHIFRIQGTFVIASFLLFVECEVSLDYPCTFRDGTQSGNETLFMA